MIGIDGPPPAQTWFAKLTLVQGIEVSIQVAANDPEAQNLANELFLLLKVINWRPTFIDETRSGIPSVSIVEGIMVSYPAGKSWTEEEPKQPWFEWAGASNLLAEGLTNAGLGVLDLSIHSAGFKNEPPRRPGLSPYFDPPLTGIYVQVGARPISLTIQRLRLKAAEEEKVKK